MSGPDPKAVERLFEALELFRTQGVDGWAGVLGPDVDWEVADDVANAGRSSGPDEVVRSAEAWQEAWAHVEYEPGEIAGEGSRVVVEMRTSMVGHTSGIEMDGTLWWAFELRDGLVARGGIYQTREQAFDRLGLTP